MVRVGREFQKDISWWIQFLTVWDGKLRMKSPEEQVVEAQIRPYSDASGMAGAAVWDGKFFQVAWGEDKMVLSAEKHDINQREMFSLVCAACTWGHLWTGKRVKFFSDNMASVRAVLNGSSKNREIMHLVRVLHFVAAIYDWEYSIEHVPGVLNVVADEASRMVAEDFAAKRSLLRVPVQLPPPSCCEEWEAKAARQLLGRLAGEGSVAGAPK